MTVPIIPRSVLFGNPERLDPKISPDAKRLAYIAPKDNVLNIYVRSTGAQDDHPVTDDRKRGIRSYSWAHNNRHIVYIQDQDGDENWHVYLVDVDSLETRDVTPFPGIQARIVALSKNYPDFALIALNRSDPKLHDVYRLHLPDGELTLDTKNPGDVVAWIADAYLAVRGALAPTPDGGSQLRIRERPDERWEPFITWGPEDSFSEPVGFDEEGGRLFLLDSRDANTAQVVEIDITSGDKKTLVSDPVYDVGSVITHPDTRGIQAAALYKARNEWIILDEAIQDDFTALSRIHAGDPFLINRDHADNIWLVGYTSDSGPVPYYIYNRTTGKAELLFTNRPELEKYPLSDMQPISFTSRDGLKIHGYLSLPVDVEPKNLPMILNVHGGPWARDTWGLNSEVQWLTNRGYACLRVNFRGSIGYGKNFVNAGNREWGGKMHDDLIDAVNWAIEEGIADPGRIGIYGASYGGYAALAGAAFTPDVFKAAVSVVGPSSLPTLIESIPPYWVPLRKVFDVRVGNIDDPGDRKFLESRSPLFHAEKIKIPMLIAQGANDPRVKQTESEQIVEALKKRGCDVQYLLFPDEGHGFARPENRMQFYEVCERFLSKHLGGRIE
jgi:dipeptidyl aminopeptidase/acylaminoacyl peptidase